MSNKKIRIVHVQVSPIFSGAVKFSYDVLSNLDKNKYELYIIYSDFEPINDKLKQEFITKFQEQGIKVIGANFLRRDITLSDLSALFELSRIFRTISPDIVNSVSSKPWILCSIISLFFSKIKFIHTIQGLSWHVGNSFFKRKIYHYLESMASVANDKLVFVNKGYMDYFKRVKNKSVYIPNCLNFSDQRPAKSLNVSSDVRLLFVGRIDPQKDIITLLKAFNLVINQSLPFKIYLDIVGDDAIGAGYELQKCKTFIEDHPALKDFVCFHGWQSDVRPFLSNADIFVSTSIYEGFGIVFLEAGNYYLPVISTDVDGIPEVVKHDFGGLLAPKGDFNQLANHIKKLCVDNNLRLQMGENHGKYVRENFSKDLIVNLYDQLYSDLTNQSFRSI